MSGYRRHGSPAQAAPVNEGTATLDGGNSTTNYLVQFNNGTAPNTGNTNPVKIDFGKAT